MSNRSLSLLSVITLIVLSVVVTGCPAPDDETDEGFNGTVYYSVNNEIRRIDLASGHITPVAEGHSPNVMSSGKIVAVREGVGLVEYLHGGSEMRIVIAQDNDRIGEPYDDFFIDPQTSPSGQLIAYQGEGGSIFVVGSSGNFVSSIGGHMQPLMRPQWLSTGELMVQGTDGLYTVSAQYELGARIFESSRIKQHTISPAGNKIAAVIDGEVWLMNSDGTQPVRMMDGSEDVEYPVWSTSGKHLVVKDGCDLKLFPFDEGMVASIKARFFSFDEKQCPDMHQLDWQ